MNPITQAEEARTSHVRVGLNNISVTHDGDHGRGHGGDDHTEHYAKRKHTRGRWPPLTAALTEAIVQVNIVQPAFRIVHLYEAKTITMAAGEDTKREARHFAKLPPLLRLPSVSRARIDVPD
jgi:hypothetical protein